MSLRGMMRTKVGLLRHRMAIQSSVETQNGRGEAISAFSNDLTVMGGESSVRASIMPLTGDEQTHAAQLVGVVTHRILIESLPGIKPKMRGIGQTAPFIGSIFDFEFVGYVSGEEVAIEILAKELV
jgi:head-tail adaptor